MASRIALSRVLATSLRGPVVRLSVSVVNCAPAASINTYMRFLSSTTKPDDKTETVEEKTEAQPEEETQQREVSSEPSKEEQLEEQIKTLKDQLVRSIADQENTRKIAKNDVEAARQFAIKSFAKSLLDVSDNLTRALEAVPKEEIDANATLKTLVEGIEMTERGLIKAFESNGLVGYGAAGEAFDPNLHDALYEYPDPSQNAGTVGQVMKRGFMLNKRVLRPAEVGVIKKTD